MLMQINFRKTECISFIAKDVSRQAKGQQDNYKTELTGSTESLWCFIYFNLQTQKSEPSLF